MKLAEQYRIVPSRDNARAFLVLPAFRTASKYPGNAFIRVRDSEVPLPLKSNKQVEARKAANAANAYPWALIHRW